MIKVFSIVPRWAWLALGMVLLTLAGRWALERHVDAAVAVGVEAERARWQEVHRKALADAQIDKLKTETTAALAALEVQGELRKAQLEVAAVRADLRVERGRLRDTIAEFRDRAQRAAEGAAPGSVAHGAVAAADALEECSSRYEAVAGVADALAVQVTGLQTYITRVVGPVCVTIESTWAFPVVTDRDDPGHKKAPD